MRRAKERSTTIQSRRINAHPNNRLALGRFQVRKDRPSLRTHLRAPFADIGDKSSSNHKAPPIDTATTPASGVEVAVPQQSGRQAESAHPVSSTFIRATFDKDETLPLFRKELNEIFTLGGSHKETAEKYRGKVQEAAISALGKILDVRCRYFDNTTPEVSKVLFDDLIDQCKIRDLKVRITERTTEFHLLSRLYRQSDRKQASADAKILVRAQNEKQTQSTFATWVKDLGGLDKILKGITDYERAKENQEKASKRTRQALQGKCKALFEAAKNVKWTNRWSLKYDEVPRLNDLLPSNPGRWSLVLVENNGEQFRLYSPQKDSAFCELLGREPKFSDDEMPSDHDNNSDNGQESATP